METKPSNIDKYRRIRISVDDGIKALLEGLPLESAIYEDSEDINLYNEHVEEVLGTGKINQNVDLDLEPERFHQLCSGVWMMPDKYVEIDIRQLLLSRCENKEQTDRIELEYLMFKERGLIPLLRFLLYLVDYMRENKHVWGVGRGSSVASYALYLLGVHKIDSLKYDLDIKEFLK